MDNSGTYAFVDNHGFVSHAFVTAMPPDDALVAPDGVGAHELMEHGYFVADGAWYALGPRIHATQVLDRVNRCWVDDVEGAAIIRNRAINDERARLSYSPIEIDGYMFDADLKSQRNLANKLIEVAERVRLNVPMPVELMIWRDAANCTHTLVTISAYHNWLSRFSIALAERNTRLFAVSWNHKDNLAALVTVAEIQAYDISTGW